MESEKDSERFATVWLKWLSLSHFKRRLYFDWIDPRTQTDAYTIGRRLDRHRKKIEEIEAMTDLFDDLSHIQHFAAQDDDLVDLFVSVHGHSPSRGVQLASKSIRPRPLVLGASRRSKVGTRSCGAAEHIDRKNQLS